MADAPNLQNQTNSHRLDIERSPLHVRLYEIHRHESQPNVPGYVPVAVLFLRGCVAQQPLPRPQQSLGARRRPQAINTVRGGEMAPPPDRISKPNRSGTKSGCGKSPIRVGRLLDKTFPKPPVWYNLLFVEQSSFEKAVVPCSANYGIPRTCTYDDVDACVLIIQQQSLGMYYVDGCVWITFSST